MGYDQRIDTAFRPSLYQPSAEAPRQRTQEVAAVTGLEKSTALSDINAIQGGAGRIGDRSGPAVQPVADSGAQQQSLSFSDLIDVINPLQHIPLISSAYRALTGDEISAPARIAGSTLYFGPIGAASAAAGLALEGVTGDDVGGHIASLFSGGEPDAEDSAAADSAETAQAGQSGIFSAAAVSPSANNSSAQTGEMSPDEPFAFDLAEPSAVADAPRAIGFAGTPEPVALESLPADILAALYSGQPVRSAGSDQGGKNTAGVDTATAATEQQREAGYAQLVEAAPRWSLWSSPDDSLAASTAAARAYGGVTPAEMSGPDGIAAQGGWFGANMPEVLARYQDTANLQRQAQRPFVDVSQ